MTSSGCLFETSAGIIPVYLDGAREGWNRIFLDSLYLIQIYAITRSFFFFSFEKGGRGEGCVCVCMCEVNRG